MTAGRPGVHQDGYRWERGLISNPRSLTFLDPDLNPVAHVYRTDDRTWTAVWADDGGTLIAEGLPTLRAALRAAEDGARPCAYIDTHQSHGILPCDNDRKPGTKFCPAHQPEGD